MNKCDRVAATKARDQEAITPTLMNNCDRHKSSPVIARNTRLTKTNLASMQPIKVPLSLVRVTSLAFIDKFWQSYAHHVSHSYARNTQLLISSGRATRTTCPTAMLATHNYLQCVPSTHVGQHEN